MSNIDINSATINGITISDLNVSGNNEVIRNLWVIYTTPAGTVPFDRNFGIDMSLLDEPINIAKAKLTVEILNKTKKYETRATVEEITFAMNAKSGKLVPKVVVSIGS